MKKFGFLVLTLTFLVACQKDYNKTKNAYQFIPQNTSTVIKTNELKDFISSIDNHDVLSNIYDQELKDVSKILKHLNTTKEVYISFFDNTEKPSNYLILTEKDSSLFVVDSIPNHISETLKEFQVEKIQIDSTTFFHKTIGKTFAASNDLEILKKIDSENENKALTDLIETTDNKSVASLIFKTTSEGYSNLLFTEINKPENKTNFTALDIYYSDNSLIYNGVTSSTDSITNFLDSFKNTVPQKIASPEIAPVGTKSLLSLTYDNFSVFQKNLKAVNTKNTDSTPTFLNFTNEVSKIDNVIVLHTLDTNMLLESIEDKSNFETFRDIEIYEFERPDFFTSRLQPFITFENAQYFSAYENFIIFSDSTENIKAILTDALNNNTLAYSDAFINANESLTDESSLFIFKDSENLSKILDGNFAGYNANIVQYAYEDNYAHINGVIQKYKKRAASNSVNEDFITKLDAPILIAPQAVQNHVTNAHDIAVQDIGNTLYLISNSGNILWKKQLQGKILGKIEQIDMYKNGRLQLAFATKNRVYILDRNGNDVSPFPLKFNDDITQPLSVFDYDKRKDYRLLVTQGKNLLMYDDRGKSINGFDYNSNGSEISSQPKHFRIGSKDYITFSAGEKLMILSRQGDIRINVKDKIRFSDNEIFLYKNKFTTTNTLGQLVQVDTKGKLSTTNLNLTDKHSLETTSKTLVTMTENKLNIKSRTVDLDYGEYTKPKIFYLNDKIYISTTDLQAKKVYLFDSQAEPIPNFPVFGTSEADLQKLDRESGLELITQSDDNNIVVYKLH
ncbi:ribonuclease HII [Winogradskyella sp. SYSU M77433]|uniref:ribonuclease HII n=1 Tax=Winogradskyella sp. SYSU M77433 TaxID=3042722 RepID=UPI0024818FEF|nr:ribonuclease HII [Winogradskyella sp. SYSU M77433]MDH7911765.1 ribonuclease HII [Winogradskyella sp. SYSU M77433]